MGVGIQVGNITDEIGTPDFLHAFFSAVSSNLEAGWGERFPVLMNKLYQGELLKRDAEPALEELAIVERELSQLPPNMVVWDCDDLSKQPPWGRNISPDITNLSNYFVTSAGRDLIGTLREALEALREGGGEARIVSF